MYLNYKANYNETKLINVEFESYYNQEIYGGDLTTIINKAVDNNISNGVEKNNKGKEKKSNKFLEFIKKHKVASAILGAILLFFIAFGATMGIVEIANPNEVQIPDLVNKTEEEAEQILKDLKLKLVVKSEEYDENIEKGKIISQDPTYKENYKIKEHSEISVIISKGTEKVDVPNVVGKTKEEAEKELKSIKNL